MDGSEDRIREQLARWRDELLDLTGRNRLLRFRHSKSSSLEIDSPAAQEVLGRLLAGRSREWTFFLPEEAPPDSADLDPTAHRVGLGPQDRRGSVAAGIAEAVTRLGVASGDRVWVSFGVVQWQHDGAHAAALALVPAEVSNASGWRIRIREPELVVNPALVTHFDREFDADLGEDRYRIESAGIQSYLDSLKEIVEPAGGKVDDRVGLITAQQHAAMLDGELNVTPTVLITETPRDGVLAGLAGAEETGLPLVPTKRPRVLGVPVSRAAAQSGPVLRTTMTTAKDVRGACANLSRRAAQEFMDRGMWILYLGVGMLHWSDPADGRAESQDSPLLLVPVKLESGSRGAEWKLLPSEEEALVNPALWLKLETELGIELPDIDPEEPLDVATLLNDVRAALTEHPMWSVEERVVLATFSFHKEAMYRDLRDNFEQILEHPIVSALARDPSSHDADAALAFEPTGESELDRVHAPEKATTILDADASQRQCLVAARDGRSFVMDGPPGTGKSQTIANMIAELVADGRSVLFVSEKAAALDVVHNRLAHVGLDEYVLELHSHKTTRSAVASALGASLMRRPKPRPSLTDRDLDDARRRREQLSSYARTINEPVDVLGGRSLHHLLGWIAALQHLPHAPVAGAAPNSVDDVEAIRELGERLRSTWEVVDRGEDFVWRGAASDTWGAGVEQRVLATLEDVKNALSALQSIADGIAEDLLLEPAQGPRASHALLVALEHLAARPADVPAAWLSDVDPAALSDVGHRAAQIARSWQQACRDAEAAAGPWWREAATDGAGRLRESITELGVDMPDGARVGDIERLARTVDDAAGHADELRPIAGDLCALIGLRSTDIALADAEAALALHAVAQEPHPPAAAWLRGDDSFEEAREAAATLLPALRAERDARSSADAFEPSVLDLDLAELVTRFRDQHTGLKKLGGAYRADRDLIAATAPSIKPKAAIAQIDAALAWQTARRAVTEAAGAHAKPLADAWAGPDTDPDVLSRQLDLADQARTLAKGRIADAARFADAISGTRPIPGAIDLATRVDASNARVRASTPQAATSVLRRPLESARDDLRAAANLLAQIAELTTRIDGVRGTPGTASQALAAASAAATAARDETEHRRDAEVHKKLGAWAALDRDPEQLRARIEWATTMREYLEATPSRPAAQRLVAVSLDPADFADALTAWTSALDRLLLEFSYDRRGELAGDLEADFADGEQLLRRLRQTRGDIETWIAHATATHALQAAGLAPAVTFCVEHRVPGQQVVDVLRRSALEALADRLLAERKDALGMLRADDRDRLVREYAQLDRQVVGDAAHRVMDAANARRPNAILGVAAIIANEAQKKKRHMPVSQLLARTQLVAQAVKPCFMMSPLSVSQFLSPSMHFDVVIFDEASQVRPCDAINALYRASAMIVAGDQKQLPPTNFFETSTDDGDEWTEDALADFDSVLDLAKGSGAFRSLSLRWHYRSRHEHLIAFSNHRFYGGDLVTFPSAAEQAPHLGVELLPVEGSYRRGTTRDNPIEAAAVTDRVFEHAEHGVTSIGVVAFSEAQASLIEAVLRQDARCDDPRFAGLFTGDRLEGLFIKNLENVQGDERDVIIFSVGYGPDEHGKMTMNFGPLNREGGWRRLNVAITRARCRVEIVCSFDAAQLAAGSNRRAVDELRRYLEFAAHGPATLAINDALETGGEPESPFEQAVATTLRSWGYDIINQVGTAGYRIDMAVRDPDRPGRFALGIECDGAMYHSSRVARDRDRLREQVLDRLGWTLHRIWGPAWYRDRSGEERRLKEAVERALLVTDAPAPPPEVLDRGPRVAVDFEDLILDAPPSWTEPYTAAVLPAGRAPDPTDPSASGELRQLILQTVTEEAPIVDDLLARRIIDAWGTMLSEKRRVVITRIIGTLVSSGTLVRHHNAVCLPNQRVDLVRAPSPDDERSQREIRHVPDVELARAVERLVADARIVTQDEAAQRCARLFGWKRNGPAIQAALMRVVEQLISDGRIARRDGHLHANSGDRTDAS